jgi:hypothetical protein
MRGYVTRLTALFRLLFLLKTFNFSYANFLKLGHRRPEQLLSEVDSTPSLISTGLTLLVSNGLHVPTPQERIV